MARLTWTSTIVLAFLAVACGGTATTEVGGPGGVRCQTTIGSPVQSVGSSGGQFAMSVSASRDCIWNASSEASWLQLSPASGQGASTLQLVVAANTEAQPRSGAFLLNDGRFTVTQDAAVQPPTRPGPPPPVTCTYVLDRTTATFGRGGGEGHFQVRTDEGCPWTVVSTAGWITILSGRVGSGPGEVRYRVGTFGGRERVGTVLAGGRTHTVTQRRN